MPHPSSAAIVPSARRPDCAQVFRRRSVEVLGSKGRLTLCATAVVDPSIGAALRLIREEAHKEARADAIARAVGLSRSVLHRRFRTLLKRSVHEELLAARIKRARELLVITDLTRGSGIARFKYQEYRGAAARRDAGTGEKGGSG